MPTKKKQAKEAPSSADVTAITVRIPTSLHERVKKKIDQTGTSLSFIIRLSLEKWADEKPQGIWVLYDPDSSREDG
jgi:predicted DNA binding CopG/RHH family protein